MPSTSIDFDEALRRKLHCYLEVTSASMSKFVRKAVNERIDQELEINPGIKQAYEDRYARLLSEAGPNVSVIPKRKRKPKATAAAAPAVDGGSEGQ